MDSLGTPDANLPILFKPLFYWVSIRSYQLYSTTTLPRRDEMKSDDYISSLVPIETEPLHLGVQGRAFQTKARCSTIGASHRATTRLQGIQNALAFKIFESLGVGNRRRFRRKDHFTHGHTQIREIGRAHV